MGPRDRPHLMQQGLTLLGTISSQDGGQPFRAGRSSSYVSATRSRANGGQTTRLSRVRGHRESSSIATGEWSPPRSGRRRSTGSRSRDGAKRYPSQPVHLLAERRPGQARSNLLRRSPVRSPRHQRDRQHAASARDASEQPSRDPGSSEGVRRSAGTDAPDATGRDARPRH